MIYIDYQKEKLIIDNTGKITLVNDPSKLRLKNAAVFMDTSSVSTKDDESYQLYTTCNTDDGKLYFLDKDSASGCKSLLHALNVRENAVVGIYFSKRLLLFTIKDGKLQKPRFTSDDISDPEYEISYTIKRWNLPENTIVEVYGHNVELGRLFDNIARTPVYLNRSAVYRARKIKEILLTTSLVVMSLCVYLYMHLSNVSVKERASDLKRETEAISSKLQAEAVQRLPLYLSSSSIPIDTVFRKLSFLENCNYTAINITVDEAGNINTKVTAANPSDAYKIKSYVENPIINVIGGVIEIQFTKQFRTSEHPEILIVGIILVILIFSFLVIPKHGELSDSKRKYSLAKNEALKQEEKLDALRSLPSFNVVLSPKSDTVLAIIKLFEKQNYEVSNFTEGRDQIGRYVSFLVTINEYSSLAGVINHLNAISQIMPVKYIGYEINDANIKVKAICYII